MTIERLADRIEKALRSGVTSDLCQLKEHEVADREWIVRRYGELKRIMSFEHSSHTARREFVERVLREFVEQENDQRGKVS